MIANKRAGFVVALVFLWPSSKSFLLHSSFFPVRSNLATGFVTTRGLQRRRRKRKVHEMPLIAAPTELEEDTEVVDQPTQEWDVSRYQSQHSFVYEYGASLVEVADPRPGERILDVGCGSGELTQALYDHATQKRQAETEPEVTSVMGMDFDPNMVQKARDQYPHLHFFQADVRKLDLSSSTTSVEDPRVDLLFSNAALHWVSPVDAPKAVAAMARSLRPGGRFVVEFGGAGNIAQIALACQEVTGVPHNFWYFPSIADVSSLLQAEGVEVTSAVLYDRPTPLEEGEDGLSNWVRMFGNKFLENLSSSKDIEDALEKINNKLRPKLWDGSQWIADYRRIRIVGKKVMQ